MAPALAMALSPIPVVIALVILIHNDRPRACGIAYLAGRATALTTLTVLAASMSSPYLSAAHKQLPRWAEFVAAATGTAFIAVGLRTWRQRSAASTIDPRWHYHVGGIRPPAAAAIGLLPPLISPKALAASAGAGAQITALASTAAVSAVLVCYVAAATSTVAAPLVIYLLAGSRIDPKLEGIRDRIAHRHNETAAATMVLMGAAIVIYGVARQ